MSPARTFEPSQLTELKPTTILLPPCGRGLGPCVAIIEVDTAGATLRCLRCDCSAPYRRSDTHA